MRSFPLRLIVVVLLLVPPLHAAQAGTKAASKAALAWLHLIDAGRYPDSWTSAAPMFQRAVSRDDWTRALEQTRAPLGRAESRKQVYEMSTTSLPGAPEGRYVVFQDRTAFTHRPSAIETVTCALDKAGTWQVAGYFIK